MDQGGITSRDLEPIRALVNLEQLDVWRVELQRMPIWLSNLRKLKVRIYILRTTPAFLRLRENTD